MAELHRIPQGDRNFDEHLEQIHRSYPLPPEVLGAWQYANDTLTLARALAKAQFGDAATPDHAVAIFQTVTADISQRARNRHTDTE